MYFFTCISLLVSGAERAVSNLLVKKNEIKKNLPCDNVDFAVLPCYPVVDHQI